MIQPVARLNGLPVFTGRDARKELCRQWGLPNWVPKGPDDNPFSRDLTVLFVDDDHNGRPVAYWKERP